ncbi:MAG: hypothetical protein ACOX3I_03915 [Limnochordia bacterium]|jgi:hypothetical protein
MLQQENLYPKKLDLSKSKTFSARNRKNLVTIENLAVPGQSPLSSWDHPEIGAVADSILEARRHGRPVVWFMGAHVIKCGLSRYVIELMRRGFISHVAGNGAVSIHDFELAYLGGTSEYVPRAIEDGSFGMWEETGSFMNAAIREGYAQGLGYGASLARYMDVHPEQFPHRYDSVIYQAYSLGVPATFHISIGADIIHQHPAADFAALGGSSGIDFAIFTHSIAQLDGGVYLNFGSAVMGAEVFLKALAISRNQGYPVEGLTTANFDIIPLGDYRSDVGQDHFHYYYRPRKNVVNRPTSLGGQGYYIMGNHLDTIPKLYSLLTGSQQEETRGGAADGGDEADDA